MKSKEPSKKLPLNGIINLNKETGVTSFEMVSKIKNFLNCAKVGHAGTLDPLARGVLLVCLGATNRLQSMIHEWKKGYWVQFDLGYATDTYDVLGKVVAKDEKISVTKAQVEAIAIEFVGQTLQCPPPFSARKWRGRPLYHYARKGISVPLNPKMVTIDDIQIESLQLPLEEGGFPSVTMTVRCGTGTYIRSLVHDMGKRLGTHATVADLVRTDIGPFHVRDSVTLDELCRLDRKTAFERWVQTMDHANAESTI